MVNIESLLKDSVVAVAVNPAPGSVNGGIRNNGRVHPHLAGKNLVLIIQVGLMFC